MYIICVKRGIVRSIKMQIKKKDEEECCTAGAQGICVSQNRDTG